MWLWIGFILLIGLLLALDLGVLNKKSHIISTREALKWTSLWVTLSLLFSVFIYYAYTHGWVKSELTGGQAVVTYLTGYLVEQSLSLDNIFVIALIFAYFQVPDSFQHRVLFWGILGAVIFRGIMIGFGIALIHRFEWMMYVFGLLLLYSAYKMLTAGESVHPANNTIIRLLKRFFPITKNYEGEQFFVRRRNFAKRKTVPAATPLFVALIMVETTDIMFAFDSIPAIFAITTDPFIVFTSNIFAILGLRSLYFVLSSMLNRFEYLKYSLVLILFFVAFKMLAHKWVNLPDLLSLGVIFISLLAGVIISLRLTGRDKKSGIGSVQQELTENL